MYPVSHVKHAFISDMAKDSYCCTSTAKSPFDRKLQCHRHWTSQIVGLPLKKTTGIILMARRVDWSGDILKTAPLEGSEMRCHTKDEPSLLRSQWQMMGDRVPLHALWAPVCTKFYSIVSEQPYMPVSQNWKASITLSHHTNTEHRGEQD